MNIINSYGSLEEYIYRIKLFPGPKDILKHNLSCTSCGRPIKMLIKRGEPIIHPVMKTLICKKCSDFIQEKFVGNEDDPDKYCRWCGQGRKLYSCSSCTTSFCQRCVRRNINKSVSEMREIGYWVCFLCDVKQIFLPRAQCWAAQQYAAFFAKYETVQMKTRHHKRRTLDSCETVKSAVSSKKKRQENLTNVHYGKKDRYIRGSLRKCDSKYLGCESIDHNETAGGTLPSGIRACRLTSAVNFMSSIVNNTADLSNEARRKILKTVNKKLNLRSINSIESVLDITTKLRSISSTLELGICSMRMGLEKYIEEWCQVVKEDLKNEEDKKDGAEAKSPEPLKKKNEKKNQVEDNNRNASTFRDQQHTEGSIFQTGPSTSSQVDFTSHASTSQECFNRMDNSLDFENAEDLSFINQFLVPTAQIDSDEEPENVPNPFSSYEECDDEWVAPPEIIQYNEQDLRGIAENRRAMFLLSSKETKNTSSPEGINWPNESDKPFEFLDQNLVSNSLSFCEEMPEEEVRWINLADVAEQIGK